MSDLPETSLDMAASAATFDSFEDFTQTFNGRKMWKTRDDLTRYARIMEATKPELVIETGTRWGGFSEWLHALWGVDVITIDIQTTQSASPLPPAVTQVIGDSGADHVIESVRGMAVGMRTMVVLDSDHHAPHVQREIRGYGPMVSPGCYLVVEDGFADLCDLATARRCGNDIPRVGGPLRAIARELVDAGGWTRDRDIEDLTSVSHHPAGWWKRDER